MDDRDFFLGSRGCLISIEKVGRVAYGGRLPWELSHDSLTLVPTNWVGVMFDSSTPSYRRAGKYQ